MARTNDAIWLSVSRVVFAGLAVWIIYGLLSRQTQILTDAIVYLSGTLVILTSLMWRRVYTCPFYRHIVSAFVPVVLFAASWIRRGPYTALYGTISASIVVLTIVGLYLSREKENGDSQ